MDLQQIAVAGVASGTVLLFAAVGEILAERAGVLNLGVEGMMLMGAVSGFSVTLSTGNPWLGLVVAMLVGGLLGLLHGIVTVQLLADQVVSGLALTFLGTGLARVLGDGLTNLEAARLPTVALPGLADLPVVGPILFDQNILVYVGFLLVPATWFWIERTRPGLHLRAVGEAPAAADVQGINVHRLRLAYVAIGGVLAGLGGATITIGVNPGWFGDQTVNGRGWIAVGLVIFARWSPIRAALGAYLFAAITPWILAMQGIDNILGVPNPFLPGRSATFFLEMMPYLFVISVVILGSRDAVRRRIGAPAALGIPYVRGERGH